MILRAKLRAGELYLVLGLNPLISNVKFTRKPLPRIRRGRAGLQGPHAVPELLPGIFIPSYFAMSPWPRRDGVAQEHAVGRPVSSIYTVLMKNLLMPLVV